MAVQARPRRQPCRQGRASADAPVPAFAAPDASDADWKNIPVPANWEIEGFSILTYQERARSQSTDVGLYRRWVEIPGLICRAVRSMAFRRRYDGAEVFVNGQRCGYHESGYTAFDIDVTKALKPGQRNLMAVRLYKHTSASLDHGDFWVLGGIYRETYLVALPQLHVEDVTVVTELDSQYKDATLKSNVRVAGKAGAHFELTGELLYHGRRQGRLAGTGFHPQPSPADQAQPPMPLRARSARRSATVSFTAPVPAPKLWSAEKPNLYYVFYRLSDGRQTIERSRTASVSARSRSKAACSWSTACRSSSSASATRTSFRLTVTP